MPQQPFSRQDLTALLVGFGLVLAVIVFFAVKSGTPDETETVITDGAMKAEKPTLPMLDPTEARKKVLSKTPAKVIDIRSEIEYQAAHVIDSVSVPADRLAEYFPAKEGDEILLISGQDDTASAKAADILSGKNVRYAFIKGGVIGWEQAGGQLVSFGNPSSPSDRSKVTLLPAEAFRKAIEDNETPHAIVDLRNKEDFSKSHIPEAMNIPIAELERRRAEIPPATNIALYARDSLDAFQGAVRLFDFGMFSVKTLEIGFSEWESKEMPVEKMSDKQ